MKKLLLILAIFPMFSYSHGKDDMKWSFTQDTINLTRSEVSSYLFVRAGKNFTASGVLMILGIGVAYPAIASNMDKDTKSYLLVGAGALGLFSIIKLVIAGNQVSKAGLVLHETTKYKVEVIGNGFRIKF